MKMTFRYMSQIDSFPQNLLAEFILCMFLLGTSTLKIMHPLCLIIFIFLSDMDSLALQGNVLGSGNSLLTYSLPFSRSNLWTSREIITWVMYLIPAATCLVIDRSDAFLLFTEELILLAGVFTAASCLRSQWWILAGTLLGTGIFLMYMILHSAAAMGYLGSENLSGGKAVLAVLLLAILFALTIHPSGDMKL